jgi:hypothetical protein
MSLHGRTKERFRRPAGPENARRTEAAAAWGLRPHPRMAGRFAFIAPRRTALVAAIAAAIAFAGALPEEAFAGGKRLRPPASVSLHPDRGMTFGRYSKTSHDQRVFKPLNQGTRLPTMDPAIDPYNLNMRTSVYEPSTGQIRGSLTDTVRDMRRAQEASRRAAREASARRKQAGSGESGDSASND